MKNQDKVETQEELRKMYADLNRYYYKLAGRLHNSGYNKTLKRKGANALIDRPNP